MAGKIFLGQSIAFLLCFGANAAHAQTVDREQFRKFLASKPNRELIAHALSGLPTEVFHTCPGLASTGMNVQVMQSIDFNAEGSPVSGAWWERVPIDGCDNHTVLNVYFVANSDGTIDTTIGLPGTTRADLDQQREATQYTFMGAGSRAKDCKQFFVRNSRFGNYGLTNPVAPDPGPHAQYRPWWETWTVFGCGRSYDVLMQFVPNASGTRIIQPPDEIMEY